MQTNGSVTHWKEILGLVTAMFSIIGGLSFLFWKASQGLRRDEWWEHFGQHKEKIHLWIAEKWKERLERGDAVHAKVQLLEQRVHAIETQTSKIPDMASALQEVAVSMRFVRDTVEKVAAMAEETQNTTARLEGVIEGKEINKS